MQHEGALVGDTDARAIAAKNRRLWPLAHSTALVVVFALPFALTFMLGMSADVAFFIGREWLVLLVLPLLAVLFPILNACFSKHRPLRATYWLSVIIPGIAFLAIAYHYMTQTAWVKDALMNRDCMTFYEKRDLQLAYDEANKLYKECGFKVETIERCPQYEPAWEVHAKEFRYLKALEERFPCAGICNRGPTMWRDAGIQAPACGPFVAQWLHGSQVQAILVFVYSILVMLAAIPVELLIVNPVAIAYDSKTWLPS